MAQSSLIFQESEKYWQAVGILTDKLGNTFRVFITGITRRDVDRFVNYQLRQQGISVIVKPIRPKNTAKSAGTIAEALDDGSKSPAAQVKIGGVTVGISRLKMVTKPPYKITYIIDPPASANPPFVTDFDMEKRAAKVLCTVTRGAVEAELLELDVDGITPVQRDAKKVTASTGSDILTAPYTTSGRWKVKVVEAAISSYFTVSWDRVVS